MARDKKKVPIKVLFMQSQTFFGADSRIHGLLMQHLDRSRVEVHAACNYGTVQQKSASAQALEKIEGLHIRPTQFGPTIYSRSKREVVYETIQKGIPSLYSLATLAGYIRKNQIQIIHCTEKPRDALYGFLLSRVTGAKCVIHLHVKAENWISPNVQWAMRNADALIGVSRFVSASMIAMGFPSERIHTVHNSLTLDVWDPETDGSKVRKEFGIAPETPLLLIVSRLFSWKGHTELLKALALLKPQIPEIKLLIVGDNDPRAHPGGGSYSEELKSIANSLGLSGNVIFTGHRSDIRQLMAACDLYTMPSFEEPFGVVYLEAMAMKKPVVALDNGGSREIVEHGESGLLSPPWDIEHLAKNIKTLIENPAMRSRMGACGRQKVEQYFSPNKMSAEVLSIYLKLLYV